MGAANPGSLTGLLVGLEIFFFVFYRLTKTNILKCPIKSGGHMQPPQLIVVVVHYVFCKEENTNKGVNTSDLTRGHKYINTLVVSRYPTKQIALHLHLRRDDDGDTRGRRRRVTAWPHHSQPNKAPPLRSIHRTYYVLAPIRKWGKQSQLSKQMELD